LRIYDEVDGLGFGFSSSYFPNGLAATFLVGLSLSVVGASFFSGTISFFAPGGNPFGTDPEVLLNLETGFGSTGSGFLAIVFLANGSSFFTIGFVSSFFTIGLISSDFAPKGFLLSYFIGNVVYLRIMGFFSSSCTPNGLAPTFLGASAAFAAGLGLSASFFSVLAERGTGFGSG